MNHFLIQQELAQLKSAFELQMHAELTSVRLKECRAAGPSDDCDAESGLSLAMRHEVNKLESPSGQLCVDVALHFEANTAGEVARRLFEIDCTFELNYVLDGGYLPTVDQVNAFKDGNAVFNCWPYAREFVQNLTTRMGLQVPPLPLLRVLPRGTARTESADANLVPTRRRGSRRVKSDPQVPEQS